MRQPPDAKLTGNMLLKTIVNYFQRNPVSNTDPGSFATTPPGRTRMTSPGQQLAAIGLLILLGTGLLTFPAQAERLPETRIGEDGFITIGPLNDPGINREIQT